jgi:hypothetical protein
MGLSKRVGLSPIFIVLLYILLSASTCKVKDGKLLNNLVKDDPILQKILKNNKEYEVQIRYTQITRDEQGVPSFHSIDYNVDPNRYFCPASTVKMPTAILAVQRIREIANATGKKLDIHTPMENIAMQPPQDDYVHDLLTRQRPTIADYADQIFCVSDNNAHNRLFEFLGTKYLNEELYKIGAFKTSHIVHRLSIPGFTPQDHEFVNAINFRDNDHRLLHHIPARNSVFNKTAQLTEQIKGKGYLDNNDKIVMQPFDFSKKNFISIIDLEACMQRVLFPEAFTPEQRFKLAPEDYTFLKRSMSILPKDIWYYAKDTSLYDNVVKYFYKGNEKATIPPHLKIYNKIGEAYGTMTDCSYFVDEKNKVEFMLTATILVNKDAIFNDGVYEYNEIGLPFFASLGKRIFEYELSR